MNTVNWECELSDGTYLIELGPSPGNANVLGRCGGHISAWVSFRKGDVQLVRTGLGGSCEDLESPVRTRVLWRAGGNAPELTEVRGDQFYR